MCQWYFTARQRFTPWKIEEWNSYIQFSGFTHIDEVVTLDYLLCPDLIDTLLDADWDHNVQADCRITWFTNLPYLCQRISWRAGQDQLLAILEQPTHPYAAPSGFEFCGFDIVDDEAGNSVLTNCGQFPEFFHPSDVNPLGLLSELDHANAIAMQIRETFPDDPHCSHCRVWQIARNIRPTSMS